MNSCESGYRYSRQMHSNLNRLQSLSLLTVAVIEGQALGGGAEILTACDIRVMTTNAKIGFVQIQIPFVDLVCRGKHDFLFGPGGKK